MQNDYSGINDEAARFTTKEDQSTRMRDEAAVELARQVHEWSKDNLARFDNDGNKHVSYGELDLGVRTSGSAQDQAALKYLEDHYKDIQNHSQSRFLFFKGAGGVTTDGIGEYVQDLAEQQAEDEKQIQASIHERALQSGSRDVAAGLLTTPDDNPNNSLFRVIDSLDGDIDNEISKKDLNRYLDEYERRSRYGDINSGFFTPETRRYVEQLRDNWDSPEMVRLRGTWTRHNNEGPDEQVPNSKISEKSLKKAIGVAQDGDMYAPFVAAGTAPEAIPADQTAPVSEKQSAENTAAAKAEAAPVETPAPAVVEKTAPAPIEKPAPVTAEKPVPAVVEKAAASGTNVGKHAHHPKKAGAPCDHAGKGKAATTDTAKPEAVTEATPAVVEAPEPAVEAPKAAAEAPNPIAEKPETQPKIAAAADAGVVEADETHRVPVSPWKSEPGSIATMVMWDKADNYFNNERAIAKLNAASALRDNDKIANAVDLNEWGKDNLRRYDVAGKNRLSYGDVDLGIRTSNNAYDSAMLHQIQDNYKPLQDQAGGGFLFIKRPDGVTQHDLEVNVQKQQEQAEANEQARENATEAREQRFRDSQYMSGLLATPDGNPNRSLFRVIDGMDNHINGEISRKDLHRYMDEYEKRARFGDVGHGFFSDSMRQYVEYLDSNWDSPDIKHLRGTYTDSDNREETHSKISLDHLRELLGLSNDQDIFQEFALNQQR